MITGRPVTNVPSVLDTGSAAYRRRPSSSRSAVPGDGPRLNRIGREVRRGEMIPVNDFELREYYDRTGKLPREIRRRSK